MKGTCTCLTKKKSGSELQKPFSVLMQRGKAGIKVLDICFNGYSCFLVKIAAKIANLENELEETESRAEEAEE